MSAMVMDSVAFYRVSRWLYLIMILCGLVFNSSLHHSPSLQPELLLAQSEEVEHYPDPFEWDNKFQVLSIPVTAQFFLTQFYEELSSDPSFVHFQVYPFSSFPIPPPLKAA